jgi:hypothetical protein
VGKVSNSLIIYFHDVNFISLRKQYQEHAKCLLQTGEGIGAGEEQAPLYKVPVTGPDAETPIEASNLWGIIHIFRIIFH